MSRNLTLNVRDKTHTTTPRGVERKVLETIGISPALKTQPPITIISSLTVTLQKHIIKNQASVLQCHVMQSRSFFWQVCESCCISPCLELLFLATFVWNSKPGGQTQETVYLVWTQCMVVGDCQKPTQVTMINFISKSFQLMVHI